MNEAYIYTYVNKITKKTYIGSRSFYTTSAEEDFNTKYKSSSKNKEFLSDMESGLLEGQIILIIKCDNAKRKIVEIEHQMIQAYWNKYGKENSYNHYCNGKFSMAGLHHSEENKQKWSKERMGENNPIYGRHLSEKQKAHLKTFCGEKASMYGKHKSQESREKLSKALKGRVFSEETKQKISKANKGRKVSEEVKQKISNKLKGRQFSEETILKMKSHSGENHHLFGKKLTEEHKRKCSEALKGRKHTLETKSKIKNKLTGRVKERCDFIDKDGVIHQMDEANANRWHPDWVKVDKIKTIE